MKNFNLDEFVNAYAQAAIWSSTLSDPEGNDSRPMDDEYRVDDIAPECMAAMRASCADFVAVNQADLLTYCERMKSEQWSGEARAGHDFWLTHNRHGAGFWDRGLGDLGDHLSDAAETYGSVDLYLGNDGLIYGN